MSIFKNLTAEEVAVQHQLLIDLLLQAVCSLGDGARQSVVDSVQKAIALSRECGSDTSVLELTLDGVVRQYGQGAIQ